ncbi:hypothetical protein ACMHYO_14410 [Allopusillimonas ginsengisoli]|uniref:hypothetical protein n=1 Tax=Allopusillimonas ginsengisoli TaxID=453575 RepID=UPI0039C2DC6A
MAQNPIGVRLNNPGNIEWGSPWQGMVPREKSMYAKSGTKQQSRFAQFTTPAYGIRALARTLITYQDKYGIRTVRAAINRWAPPVENVTSAYVAAVAKAVGVSPDQQIDLQSYKILRPMVSAIIRHENGKGPLSNANTWYDSPTLDEGLRLAGVRPEKAAVPVTKETIGATATGAVGVAQIADVLPAVSDALTRSEDHLSSGSIVRIVLGVATIAFAVFIAYSQVKKHQSGAL